MSKLAGYAGVKYRTHNGNYAEMVDMEPASQPLYAGNAQTPALPVPDLDATLDLFLQSAKPHVSAAELKQTEKAVEEMRGPVGRELHARLLARAEDAKKKRTSWFINWWNQWAYLAYRDSVAYNVTYEILFKDECATAMADPTRRAARFVKHALEYRKMVATGTLPPDVDAKTKLPWENSQHKYLFNCCRMPVVDSDLSRTYAPDLHGHLVVARKNRFYAIDVCDETGLNALSLDAIHVQMRRAVALADAKGADVYPVGILTAEDRDAWAKARPELLQPGAGGALNEQSLEKIQSAVFVVCFDDEAPVTRRDVARHMLLANGRNRFWDKSFNISVTATGKMAYVGEHSLTDGMTVTRFVNWTLAKMFADPESSSAQPGQPPAPGVVYAPGSAKPLPEPEWLRFDLTDKAVQAIKKAEVTFDAMCKSKEFEVLMFFGYGSEGIKKFGCSPDAFAQMAMQLAYRKTFGKCRGTYESTQTRTYMHGRTEVTRSVSVDSEAFCNAVQASAPREEIRAKLVKACEAHSKYTHKASKGLGCDRHLLGLKFLVKPGETMPALYSDPGYLRSGHWAISTSGLMGENMDGWCFGEVVPDGIGIGYSVQQHRLRFSVTSRHPDEKWAGRMCQHLEEALALMASVFADDKALSGGKPAAARAKL